MSGAPAACGEYVHPAHAVGRGCPRIPINYHQHDSPAVLDPLARREQPTQRSAASEFLRADRQRHHADHRTQENLRN